MQSSARYEGEASMAATARDTATDDAARLLFDRAWADYATAARHVRLSLRWAQTAAADRQQAAQPPKPNASRRGAGAEDTATKEQLEARAERSLAISQAHAERAERRATRAAETSARAAGNGAPRNNQRRRSEAAPVSAE
jgi:hypothetical protein